MNAVFLGLILATFAGLSTVIGGFVVFFIKELKPKYLSFSLAFSTGVMITISFIELLPAGIETIGYAHALIGFFGGATIAFLIDYSVPHEYIMEKAVKCKTKNTALIKLCSFTAIGIAIHNFPEGFAVLAGNLQSLKLGLITSIAIAMHNIPEGVAVAIPMFFATKKKRKALWASFLSGLAEPIGALIGALILLPFLSAELVGASLAIVAGIMVYICIDELLPTAMHYAKNNTHLMTFGFLLGSAVMGATLVILA
ncbi:MAG: zinc transporter ZupT [Candidatus Diapherotrites archaeon]|nr:zinc transporter ZupT [Candidatus Diapherotrites archaeon]